MFSKNKGMKDGHINSCKDCVREKERLRKNQIIVPAKMTGTMICPVCNRKLDINEFKIFGKSKTGRDWLCRSCREYHSALNNGEDKNKKLLIENLVLKISKELCIQQLNIELRKEELNLI